jgi:hypothetical protein
VNNASNSAEDHIAAYGAIYRYMIAYAGRWIYDAADEDYY